MKKILLSLVLVALSTELASAQNYPCSGKARGVSHCSGGKFVCNDGRISKSKKRCDSAVHNPKPKANKSEQQPKETRRILG